VRSPAHRSAACDRARFQIALAVDHELSGFERALKAAHVARCAECRLFEADLSTFTGMLREASLERMTHPVVVRRPRAAWKLRVVSTAAVAMLALSLAGWMSQIPANEGGTAARSGKLASPTEFPTGGELETEIAVLELASGHHRVVALTSNLR
jgi:hypothetical protein